MFAVRCPLLVVRCLLCVVHCLLFLVLLLYMYCIGIVCVLQLPCATSVCSLSSNSTNGVFLWFIRVVSYCICIEIVVNSSSVRFVALHTRCLYHVFALFYNCVRMLWVLHSYELVVLLALS